MTEPAGGLFGLIPVKILRDDMLPPNAKLLFADIFSLTRENGYCYASNEYLMGLYGWSGRTIQRLIKSLEERGYIRIEQEEGKQRLIFVCIDVGVETPDKNVGGRRQKCRGTLDNSVAGNKVDKNNIINTPLTPQRGTGAVRRKREPREAPDWRPERFAGLWAYYPKKGRKNKQDAMRAWDDLRATDDLIDRIGLALKRLKASDEWRRGVGIPYVATFLRGHRWNDAEALDEDDLSGKDGEPFEDRRLL